MNALDTGRSPEISGREARKAVELIEAIYRSSKEDRAIKF